MAESSVPNGVSPSTQSTKVPKDELKTLLSPVKGKADWRDFACFELPNGVTVCLVHDKEAKTTAAAACVAAGAAADPRNLSGLAHFCEHMCFLGSVKYPGENEYKRYLSTHGGRSNASTSLHLTTYKFEVLAEHAEHAIDIFSHFFVEPLFTQSGTSREVHAVDSENSKNLTADTRRRLQILKDLADPNHYFSKFTTGNATTLPTDTAQDLERIRKALLSFHDKHYRPDNLTVVVAGPQSLSQLEEWVIPRFAPMQTSPFSPDSETEQLIQQAAQDAPPYSFQEPAAEDRPAFVQNDWPFLLTTKPIRSTRRLVMMFPMPSVHKNPDQAPTSVLSHLLGHEGPHSSFAILQNAGLLDSLAAGCRVMAPDFTLFQIDMNLTDLGEQQWKQVVDVILQHGRLIHHATKQRPDELQRIWEESIALSHIFFDQTSPGTVYDLAPRLCQSIVQVGTEQCLSAGSMLKETKETFPLEQVADFSSRLTAENCIIERCSEAAWKEMEVLEQTKATGIERKTEPWYGIDYFVSKIDAQDVQVWQGKPGATPFLDASELKLPRPNQFIPRTLELCPDLSEEDKLGPRIDKKIDPPKLLIDDPTIGRLWHRLDDRYALPKSVLTLLVRNAAVDNSKIEGIWQSDANAHVHSAILAAIFSDAMAQETYDADLAGLYWNLSLAQTGMNISCSGFSDRLPDLALQILHDFLSNDNFVQKIYFDAAKDRLLRNLRTYFESRRADSHASFYREFLLSSQFGVDESIAAAEAATLESTKQHYRTLLQNQEAVTDCLFSGNVSETDAKAFFSSASKAISEAQLEAKPFDEKSVWIPGPTERRLIPGEDIELHFASKNLQEENGAVLVTYQSPIPGFRGDALSSLESLQSTAAIRLLSQIIREPLFDELRTKQTLGYIVSSYYDIGFACRPPEMSNLGPLSVPVDFFVVSVLSRKLSPPEVAIRIDDFIKDFRNVLANLPDSEIEHHATALSTKLLKPFQKLNTEASNHFAKIRRYAPEVLNTNGGTEDDLPWGSVETLARAIRGLRRKDLLQTWDRLVQPQSRARVVSCVYGTTFPLDPSKISKRTGKKVIVNSLPDVLALRNQLPYYDDTPCQRRGMIPRLMKQFKSNQAMWGVAAVSVMGAGFIGWTVMSRTKKTK